ncbi:cilia- and flagella-associated protein 58-like [Anoplophora glabripennis]|uniref:cilia- and flagella-associated protein 58-like n=1 Tax=Anoplophora glabripennis TaxID=217634 RepID=UPI000875691A|nr:cilia- and flagella-associated protein 58-like [Anoplophora glabripennis]
MEMIVPQTKRIKLEHSYAYLADTTQFEPVTVKEEDPLKLAETDVESIKIEVADDDNLVKTEPAEEIVEEGHKFEYFSVTSENEYKIPPDHNSVDRLDKIQNVGTKIECETPLDNPVDDPLKLVSFEYVAPDVEKPNDKKKTKKNVLKVADSHLTSFLRLQKERDNLQKTIKKLRTDLKDVKAREKALQTELGARRMSELSLEEMNADLNCLVQESIKKEKANTKTIKELNQRLSQAEKENQTRSDISERMRRDFSDRLEKMKAQLRKRDLEHRNLDVKCGTLTHNLSRLTAKYDVQKHELAQVKQKLHAVEQSQMNSVKSSASVKQQMAELSKELAVTKRTNEELQKSLLTEKKMSRFFIKERDQLLEEQDAKFKEADKELVKLKQSVGSLTAALTQKIAECKTQKDATKVVMITYQKKSLELRRKMEELEKKQEELSKKECEYCGF